jgi:glucokinase-like ROK family protein
MKGSATANLMRSINRAAILTLIRGSSPISRSKIGRDLNMSLPTVMRIVDELIEEDLVRYCGKSESTGGRPQRLLEFNGKAYAVVGVDLGGTKMFGTVADLSGNIQHELYLPHKEGRAPTDHLEHLCHFIQALLDVPRPGGQRIRGIGIGAPGVVQTPAGVVTWAPSLGWRDLPLQEILSERFDVSVSVDNDVNLTALGEWGFGAGQGAQNLVSIAVGTGIGAGIIINGALYRGHDQAAGEVGYLPPGIQFLRQHYDGFGALESLASGAGIAERAARLRVERGLGVPPEGYTSQDVFAAARKGERWAEEVIDETVDYLSLAIAAISAVLNPEVVILGGGVAASADLLIEPILNRLEGVVPYLPRLVASPLGRRAAAMGAIMLVLSATTQHLVINRLR